MNFNKEIKVFSLDIGEVVDDDGVGGDGGFNISKDKNFMILSKQFHK
jgi:hypothetical protein